MNPINMTQDEFILECQTRNKLYGEATIKLIFTEAGTVVKFIDEKEEQGIKKLTKEQAAIIGVYTGVSCGPFADIHDKIEQVLGRSVWTHEMANKKFMEEAKEKIKPEFLAICAD